MNKFEAAARDFMAADAEVRRLAQLYRELRDLDWHTDEKRGDLVCRFNNPEEPATWCEQCQAFDWNARTKALQRRQRAKNRMRRWYPAVVELDRKNAERVRRGEL